MVTIQARVLLVSRGMEQPGWGYTWASGVLVMLQWGHWVGSCRGLRRKELAQPLRWSWVNKPGSSAFIPSRGVSSCP